MPGLALSLGSQFTFDLTTGVLLAVPMLVAQVAIIVGAVFLGIGINNSITYLFNTRSPLEGIYGPPVEEAVVDARYEIVDRAGRHKIVDEIELAPAAKRETKA